MVQLCSNHLFNQAQPCFLPQIHRLHPSPCHGPRAPRLGVGEARGVDAARGAAGAVLPQPPVGLGQPKGTCQIGFHGAQNLKTKLLRSRCRLRLRRDVIDSPCLTKKHTFNGHSGGTGRRTAPQVVVPADFSVVVENYGSENQESPRSKIIDQPKSEYQFVMRLQPWYLYTEID